MVKIIFIMLCSFAANGQSLYYKRMQNVDDRPATWHGQDSNHRSVLKKISNRMHQRMVYARKRRSLK